MYQEAVNEMGCRVHWVRKGKTQNRKCPGTILTCLVTEMLFIFLTVWRIETWHALGFMLCSL